MYVLETRGTVATVHKYTHTAKPDIESKKVWIHRLPLVALTAQYGLDCSIKQHNNPFSQDSHCILNILQEHGETYKETEKFDSGDKDSENKKKKQQVQLLKI